MRKTLKCLLAALLSLLIAAQIPMQVFSEAASDEIYISEIKLGIGDDASKAEAALAGYEILKDANGKYVDLNRNAGTTNFGGKGNRVVYLGFIRTSDDANAITDLAVMNMRGGYSVPDYETMMEKYRNEQVIPMVEGLLAAIREYRQNYQSDNARNRKKAIAVHDALNKLTDDDCDGAGLGDLLLNPTKYEMGDSYDALPKSKQLEHADLVTIVEQSNGQAMLILQNLLFRAADTAEDTWIDRFADTTYEDLVDETGLTPSKAKKELSRLYYDDAIKLVDIWDAFKEHLDEYDDALKTVKEEAGKDLSAQNALIEKFDFNTASNKEIEEYADAVAEVSRHAEVLSNAYTDVLCTEYLKSVKYGDESTLLNVFTMSAAEVENDITSIYPLVASLSEGQRGVLDFVTLQDLVMIGATDENGYQDGLLDKFKKTSIYENVDRAIYEKDNVALTSDSLRSDVLSLSVKEDSVISPLTYILGGLTAASVVALGVTLGVKVVTSRAITAYNANINAVTQRLAYAEGSFESLMESLTNSLKSGITDAAKRFRIVMTKTANELADANYAKMTAAKPKYLGRLQARSSVCSKLAKGFGVAMILLIAATTYMTYRDLMNRYNVDYTPIPRYLVDEKEITGFNANGDRIVLKNQAAYYKAALCNRKSGDSWFKELGDVGDLNGTVGKEWLALYAETNKDKPPILADSLFVTGSSTVPADYEHGIHLFGSDAVFNLNSTRYCWNSSAPEIYVYYKLDASASAGGATAGSVFSPGIAAIFGAGGVALGAAAAVAVMAVVNQSRKKKKKEENGAEA